MYNQIKKIFCFALLIVPSHIAALSPYFSIRSQGDNLAREMAGLTNHINLANDDFMYGTWNGTLAYDHSFKTQNLVKCLFGPDLITDECHHNAIRISGSQTTNRLPTDWLADYFGLPTDYISVVTFKPIIQNLVVDLYYYIGLDEWVSGLYFKIDAPITRTKWFVELCEDIIAPGANEFAFGYFSSAQEANVVESFIDYISGDFTPELTTTSTSFPAGIFHELANARISRTPLVRVGVAEIRATLGWNWACPDYHIGLKALFAFPTGTRPEGQYALEPIVGNGHHYEFGFGTSAHWSFWNNECETQKASIYLEANFTHLFKGRQRRTFDLKNKPNSRYMLAQNIGTTQLNPHLANPPFPGLEFQSQLAPVANLTTFDVDVKASIKADVVLWLNYTLHGFSFDFGYNFWGRACEQLIKNGAPSALDDGMSWALKGDAFIIGFDPLGPLPAGPVVPVRMAATERAATIHAGTNFPASGTIDPVVIAMAQTNPNIDTPAHAFANDGNQLLSQPTSSRFTNSSLNPVFLNIDDVDITGTKGVSNKLFGHFSYTWNNPCRTWTPYLGIGGEVEWGSSGNCSKKCGNQDVISCTNECAVPCNPCFKCTLSQYGVWIKGGVSF